jgi:hypothetical protein
VLINPNRTGAHPVQPTPHPALTIDNHRGWALACLALFWPLAIPAITAASRVDALLAAGDRAGAEEASRSARSWALRATIIGIVWWVLVLCFCGFGLFAAGDPQDSASFVHHLVG